MEEMAAGHVTALWWTSLSKVAEEGDIGRCGGGGGRKRRLAKAWHVKVGALPEAEMAHLSSGVRLHASEPPLKFWWII